MPTIEGIKQRPRVVNMRNPATGEPWKGQVVARACLDPEWGGPRERDELRVMDRIVFSDGREVIRLGYYIKGHEEPEDVWRWGSQTTFSATVEDLEELLKRGREEGVW